MKTLKVFCGALAVWAAASALPASAGWDNVFQPTLFERWRQPAPSASYYVAPVVVTQYQPPVVVASASPCATCPQPTTQNCQTNYVQRSYYQPVTVMQTETRYEAVTTFRSSYYYEPVTSYRYSLYVDPCSGCSQQVATPTVSYLLREQRCPVQSWVARCVQVPVQAQQLVSYWQPVTTCCTTTQGAPIIAGPPPAAPQPPLIQGGPTSPPPSNQQPPSIRPENKGTSSDQYYPKYEKIPEGANGTSFRQPSLGTPTPVRPNVAPAPANPPVKFNQIAVNPNSTVEGQVVRSDNAPKGNAKVLFVNASTGKRESITTNSAGRFQLELATGSWHVYLYGIDGQPTHQTRIDVNGAQIRQVSLVSRGN